MNEWLDINHWQHIGIGILMEISTWTFWTAAALKTLWQTIVG